VVAYRRRTDPDRLARRMRGDLDRISLKALEKDPSRRYDTAAEMAADIRRVTREGKRTYRSTPNRVPQGRE
jgi:hypothetical protein